MAKYALDKEGRRIIYSGPATTLIKVRGVEINTERLSNDEYKQALIYGIERMLDEGALQLFVLDAQS